MSQSFLEKLGNTLTNGASNVSITENGAVGYKTTGKKLLDLNFAVSSLRSRDDSSIEHMFSSACAEDINTAIVWLFFARDVRGGLGERRLFRVCMKYLAREFSVEVRKILPLISEYGRWDDLVEMIETKVHTDVYEIIRKQLVNDMNSLKRGESVSLLAKWMPSENASSNLTQKKALQMRTAMKISPRSYRMMMSALRKHINIIERKMSSNEWNGISYEAVPSRANLIYNDAFLRHDEDRRREYLGNLEKGEAKINSSVLFPHDIVLKYGDKYCRQHFFADEALEGMWKALPNTVGDNAETIVVADGSGSMNSCIGNDSVRAIDVANAMAIYFAERLSGPYKDKYITFSENPKLVNLAGAKTLFGKLNIANQHKEVANTNIDAVFNLILDTAVQNNLAQKDLPKNILIISDMEFDSCACASIYDNGYYSNAASCGVNANLFEKIKSKYVANGYDIPRLVFWNVNSRTGTIPVKENELGVALVSGFSPNVAKMVMSSKLDPMDALLDTLNSDRYEPVRAALAS